MSLASFGNCVKRLRSLSIIATVLVVGGSNAYADGTLFVGTNLVGGNDIYPGNYAFVIKKPALPPVFITTLPAVKSVVMIGIMPHTLFAASVTSPDIMPSTTYSWELRKVDGDGSLGELLKSGMSQSNGD